MSLWDENYHLFGDAPFRDVEEYNHPTRKMIVDKSRIGTTVLECGCASCVDYEHFKGSGVKYTGIDITSSFVMLAKRYNPEVDVMVGDILKIDFEDGSYDTVYCRNVLEHLVPGDWTRALTEMYRVTRKQILVSFFIPPDMHPTVYLKDGYGFYNNKYNVQEIFSFCLALEGFSQFELIQDVGNATLISVLKWI